MTHYNLVVANDGTSTVTIVSQGQLTTIDDTHPAFSRIVDAVVAGDDPTEFLTFSLADEDGFGEDEDGDVVWGEEPVGDPLVQAHARYVAEGRNTANFSRFMDRLSKNPSRHSRQALWDWLNHQGLNVDTDGYLIGFKGVYSTDEDGLYVSGSSGTASVDGVEFENQQIPQRVGSVVEMPRTEVMDDPTQACSYGLHVGTWSYASGFGPITLEVRIDPADVVSVPNHDTSWKIRCCKYKVLAVHEPDRGNDLTAYEPEATYDPEHLAETLSPLVPSSFLERMRARLGRKAQA